DPSLHSGFRLRGPTEWMLSGKEKQILRSAQNDSEGLTPAKRLNLTHAPGRQRREDFISPESRPHL
ncbi:MAG TPA: hypothetical protein VNM47_18230, partial [Terriglobia bacterium]|nr:hypothetical protein [Terriglobia bacterium]